ncbi:unnamed protein product [Pseudo-nitzschia multistriata]|uniref:PPM-type phosphatase domain-containing protein n=1 Tax=Pseudo-nitzschia multistriata TaxID=183589 RepID=A0A448ZGU5_9STRA|nr:unnamed protein product [Pseudo-nitzschia multistriata]
MKSLSLVLAVFFLAILAVFVMNFVVLFWFFPVPESASRPSSAFAAAKGGGWFRTPGESTEQQKHRKKQQRPPLRPSNKRHPLHHQTEQATEPPIIKPPDPTESATSDPIPAKNDNSTRKPSVGECRSFGCPIYPPELTNPLQNATIRDALESSRLGGSPGSKSLLPDREKAASIGFAAASFATLSQKGESHTVNQDRAVYVPSFLSDLLVSSARKPSGAAAELPAPESFLVGLFDGHGELGHDVAEEVVEKLPVLLAEKLTKGLGGGSSSSNGEFDDFKRAVATDSYRDNSNNSTNTVNNEAIVVHAKEYDKTDFIIRKALNETFLEVNKKGTSPTFYLGGCTASVALRWGSKLYVANAGDSTTILVSAAEKKAPKKKETPSLDVKVEYQTRRDKANQPGERERIEKLGGKVHVNAQGFDPRVIVYSHVAKDTIGLAMSRSLGDWEWKVAGVTAEPTIDVIDLSELSEPPAQERSLFLLAASDGFWDMRQQHFLATLSASSFVVPSRDTGNESEEEKLLRPLFHLYDIIRRITPKEQTGYRDDITATIVRL